MGRRFIRLLDGHLHHLRDHCTHGNRRLFYDQLVVAHLLAFFNPILAGLRRIEDVFDVPAVRRRLKCMANFKHFYSESPQGMTL